MQEVITNLIEAPLAFSELCYLPVLSNALLLVCSDWHCKKVIANPQVGVTFDLYDIGLVFFDKKRCKEHRIVNFF